MDDTDRHLIALLRDNARASETGIGAVDRLSITVSTSSAPSFKRYVISMVCANGNCAIQSGSR